MEERTNTKEVFWWSGRKFEQFDDLFRYCTDLAKKRRTEKDAVEMFNGYAKYIGEVNSLSDEKAMECAKRNFGYYAGYFDRETEDIVNKVFDACHPMFGGRNSHDVDPKEAFELGQKFGAQQKAENEAKKQ